MGPFVLEVALLLPALYPGHLRTFFQSLPCTQRHLNARQAIVAIPLFSFPHNVFCVFIVESLENIKTYRRKSKLTAVHYGSPAGATSFSVNCHNKVMCWRTWSPARGSGLGGCRNQLQMLGVNPLECALMVTPTSASVSYSHQPEMRGSLTTLSLMPGHSDHCTFPPYWTEPAETIRQNAF